MSLPLPTIAARIITVAGFSFPRTLTKLERMMSDGGCSSTVVAAVVSSDPVLTALALGRASAGAEGEILQLSNAVLLLGMDTVAGMIQEVMPITDRGVRLMAGCWSHANATATMARILAAHCPALRDSRPDDEQLHVAGLVHDLGTMVAAMHFTAEYETAIARLRRGEGPFATLLKEELGAEPGELGALVAKAWNLPTPYAHVVRHHQRPTRAGDWTPLACVVHIARELARGCGFCSGHDIWVEPISPEAMALLELKPSEFGPVLDGFFAEMDDLETYDGLLARTMRA